MECSVTPAKVDRNQLREAIHDKYTAVAETPEQGFHFHTGRPLALMLGYDSSDVDRLPRATVDSFAGTGNPFSMGSLRPGETVVDLGCGAGFDSLIAAAQVGPSGTVIPIDMTEAMVRRTREGAAALGLKNVHPRIGYLEEIPVADRSVDVVISNGVLNLTPDKVNAMEEVARILKPGGRIQIGDIVVHNPVPQDAKDDIELWSG
jgi:SAM-dependent methyltransferase